MIAWLQCVYMSLVWSPPFICGFLASPHGPQQLQYMYSGSLLRAYRDVMVRA